MTRPRFNKHAASKLVVYLGAYLVTSAIIWSSFILAAQDRNDLPILRLFIIVFASALLYKYFLYMLVSPWYDLWAALFKRRTAHVAYTPKVSVLVPAWNEEVGLLTTVKSLLASEYKNLEIVVVNDGSTDNSDKMMRDFVADYKKGVRKMPGLQPSIVYRYQQNGGKGKALNTGIDLASGDILMSIDADCYVPPQAVGNFVRYFADPNVMAAVGNVKIGNTKTFIGVVQSLEFLFSFYFKKADSLMNSIYIIGGAAGAFRREVFEQLGGYNHTNITEDIELSMRIQDAGMKIVYAADALVYTEGAIELSGLKKQRVRWKRGRFQTFQAYRHMFFSRKAHHNKLLCWLILPLAMLGEVQLFMELWFLAFLYVYSLLIQDFSSFISGVIVVSFMFLVQILFDDKKTRKLSFSLLSPIGWLLFYLATYVEFNALIKSLWGFYKKEELKWQQWKRQGVQDEPVV